jgi:hypothetical protein
VRLVRTRVFQDSLERLRATDAELFEVVAADIEYLIRAKRGAELPQVRWGIAQSEFVDVTGEIRSHIPGRPEFVRTLFVMPDDESICAFAVMGDKNTVEGRQGDDWYDEAVPLLDEMWRRILGEPQR